MFPRSSRTRFLHVPALLLLAVPAVAQACASCGCTLSSDWQSQNFATEPGFKFDLRYDLVNQEELRHGRGTISSVAASGIVNPDGTPQEVEKSTRNDYLTLGVDYMFASGWGVNVQLPYIHRNHSTLGTNSNGYAPADEAYTSDTSDMGDVKVIARYQGLTPQRNVGLMFGLKLPTGSHARTGTSTDPLTPGTPAPIDRGLQPGTGTTDLILGVLYFDTLNKNWDYFGQAMVQAAITTSNDYRPGDGYNLTLGLRYMGFDKVIPQLQLNLRDVKHDNGANADRTSTGGTLLYLSPGLVLPVGEKASLYGFVQLPLYEKVRGVQLTPRNLLSIGARFSF
jgi:hypothetical protein